MTEQMRSCVNMSQSCSPLLILSFVYFSCSFISADEYFTIKRNNLRVFRDRFQVPVSQRGPKDFFDKFRAEKYQNSKSDCWCPLANSTFGYYENACVCYGNTKLRSHQACRGQIVGTNPVDALRVVTSYRSTAREYRLNLTNVDQSCQISTLTYQKCGGQWQSYSPSDNNARFSLRYDSSNKVYKLKVSPADTSQVLDGHLIKLVIECASHSHRYCLLIKLRGSVKCSTKPPVMPTTTAQPSTTPSRSSPQTVKTTTLTRRTTWTNSVSSSTVPPGGRDNSGMDGEASMSVPAVVGGVVAGLLTIIIAVVVVLVILRRKKKKRANTSGKSTRPTAGACYEVPQEFCQNGPTAPADGSYIDVYMYEDMTTKPQAPEGIYMEAFQKPLDKDKATASSGLTNGSSEGAVYDLPFLGPTSASGRVTSEYEPLRRVGSGLQEAGYLEPDARQSVYQELQRPGQEQEQEPLYEALA